MLFKNSIDESTMLDWVGEHQWNSMPRLAGTESWHACKGKYERFARWYSTSDGNFPPMFATKMAISPDDSLLAFSTNEPTNHRVFIYDFNAQNFGALTQMEGCITEYYTDGGTTVDDYQLPISPGKTIHNQNIKLTQAFTFNEPHEPLKVEPFNFLWTVTPGGTQSCVRILDISDPQQLYTNGRLVMKMVCVFLCMMRRLLICLIFHGLIIL